MITIKNIRDLAQVYDYQIRFPAPFFFPTNFESWLRSFTQDVNGEGRLLFRNLDVKAAFDGNTLVGFVQYGSTAFGFDAQIHPTNVIDHKKIEIKTPDVIIKVAPDRSDLIETRVIGGLKYILIQADENVEVNGVNIEIADREEALV